MIEATHGDEVYHDLAAARQQAASILVSGPSSSSMDLNDVVTQKMSFNECGNESIELTVSFQESTAGLIDNDHNEANIANTLIPLASSTGDKVSQTKSTNKRGGGAANTDAPAGEELTTNASLSSIQPIAPDIAKEYYNVITSSAMMGSVPRLFSSDAANNYYHAMLTRNLLNDDTLQARGGTSKKGSGSSGSSWMFGKKTKNKSNEGVKEDDVLEAEKEALIGDTEAERSDAEINVKVDEEEVIDGTTKDSGGASDPSSTKSGSALKKLVADKLFITKSADSYERLSDDNAVHCGGKDSEVVTVETVSESSGCDSSDSTILSGNSSNSVRCSGLNDVGDVVTDTIEGNTKSTCEDGVTTRQVVNDSEDDSIERSRRSPVSGSGGGSVDANNHNVKGSDNISTNTESMPFQELLAKAVAASTTPEDVARYLVDYETGSVSSNDKHNPLDEMLLAEAVVASTTPDDVARYLLEHERRKLNQTKNATNDQTKQVVVTSETCAEIVPTEFTTNEIPESRSMDKKTNSLSSKLRTVRSMSPSVFNKKEMATNSKDVVSGSIDAKSTSRSKDTADDLNCANSTRANSNESVGFSAASSAMTLDELLAEAVVASTTPEDVAQYLLGNGPSNQTKQVVVTSETSAEIVPTEFPTNEIPESRSWGKKNSLSKKLRSVRSMSPSVFKRKEVASTKKAEATGSGDETTIRSNEDDADNGLNSDHSSGTNSNKSVEKCNDEDDADDNTVSVRSTGSTSSTKSRERKVNLIIRNSSMTLDELLIEAVAASTTPEDVARYLLDHKSRPCLVGTMDSMRDDEGKETATTRASSLKTISATNAEASVEVFTTDVSAGGLSPTKSWGQKNNGQSKQIRSVRSMSPSLFNQKELTSSSSVITKTKGSDATQATNTTTIKPIPSSPNDTSPVFGSDIEPLEVEGVQRECIDSSAIAKCVSFDKQVIEKDEVKQANAMKSIALPPLTPRHRQNKTPPQRGHPTVATSPDDDGSVECSFMETDMMALKSAPSCGGCSIRTEYVSESSHRRIEDKQVSKMVEDSTVNIISSNSNTNVSLSDGEQIDKEASTVIDMTHDAGIVPGQKIQTKSSINEVNNAMMPGKTKVSLSSLISSVKDAASVDKLENKDAATATVSTSCVKTQETAASTVVVDENEYEVVHSTVIIDSSTTPKFCVDPKAMVEEFISDLKSVQSSVKSMFGFFSSSRKDTEISSMVGAKDDDDASVISWSRLKGK